jgi:hypothetical protein
MDLTSRLVIQSTHSSLYQLFIPGKYNLLLIIVVHIVQEKQKLFFFNLITLFVI